MNEENKAVELTDEQLEQVSGGVVIENDKFDAIYDYDLLLWIVQIKEKNLIATFSDFAEANKWLEENGVW